MRLWCMHIILWCMHIDAVMMYAHNIYNACDVHTSYVKLSRCLYMIHTTEHLSYHLSTFIHNSMRLWCMSFFRAHINVCPRTAAHPYAYIHTRALWCSLMHVCQVYLCVYFSRFLYVGLFWESVKFFLRECTALLREYREKSLFKICTLYIFLRAHAHMPTYTSLSFSLSFSLSPSVSLSLSICVCVYIHIARALSLSLSLCVCVCVCVCVYTFMNIHVYIYI